MDANTLADAVLESVLDRMPVARLAVIDELGHPEVMPIVFARVGRMLFSPIDGKPKKHGRLARLTHIERNARVGLVLDHYAADWQQLWWIRLRAEARIAAGTHAYWDAAVAALRTKYPQYGETALFQREPVMIYLEWSDVRWWAADGVAGLMRWLGS